MHLARRTPLAGGLAELQHVHALLYAGDADDMAAGAAAVRVWLNRGACAQAAEATAFLVEGLLAEQRGTPQIAVRSACAMALVRFVNSIADSFQTGMYAQSIAAIAERIDLPQWLVQVRHAATHEELPSLAVCRQATHLALEWLDTHYWQPSLAPVSAADDAEEHHRHAAASTHLAQLLHAYRTHARAIARDRSMARRGGAPLEPSIAAYIAAVATEIERRIAHSQRRGTAAALARAHGEALADNVADICTASVLMLVIAQLLLPGALVPSSKDTRSIADAVEIWEPLVHALIGRFALFTPLLLHALARTASSGTRGATHAGAWLVHFAALDTNVACTGLAWDFGDGLPSDAAATDAPAPWPCVRPPWRSPTSARRAAVLFALEEASERTFAIAAQLADDSEKARVAELTALWRGSGTAASSTPLDELEKRGMAISGIEQSAPDAPPPLPTPAVALPPGWQMPSTWLPTPIGCLAGSMPALELES